MILFKLEQFLVDNRITRNELAREANVRPNTVYDICANNTKRIEIETLDRILETLSLILKREVVIQEIVEFKTSNPDNNNL